MAVVEAENLLAETNRERGHLDAAPARDQEMAQFVDEHDDREYREERCEIEHRAAQGGGEAGKGYHQFLRSNRKKP